MDVKRLELLRELAERGSVTEVAYATGRTPSAVSQQLKVLEREAGLPLMEPAGRGIALTAAGRALAQTATEIAIAIERAESAWREYAEQPAGDVTLTTFPTGGAMLLPNVLNRLSDTPGLRLICSDQEPAQPDFADLTSDFDIVLADTPTGSRSWRDRGLKVVPRDLIGETWIGSPVDFPNDRILQDIAANTGEPVHVVQRLMDNRIIEALVAAGLGLAILPRYTTRERENGLITRPLAELRSRRDIAVLMRPDRAERPSVQLVVDTLRDEAQRLEASHQAAKG